MACLLNVGQAPHTGVWTATTTTQHLPTSLARLFSEETLSHLNVASCLISAILAVLLIATAPEEFGIPECTTTVEAAGLDGPHRWGIILPNSSRVSLLTYKANVAVRYPELVLHDQDPIQIGHFVPHDHTVEHGGFRTVQETNWDAQREKACVNTYAHASASQICLQNICGQQQNFPMAGPTFGSKSGPQKGAQAKT